MTNTQRKKKKTLLSTWVKTTDRNPTLHLFKQTWGLRKCIMSDGELYPLGKLPLKCHLFGSQDFRRHKVIKVKHGHFYSDHKWD